jgi:hypothetical protein
MLAEALAVREVMEHLFGADPDLGATEETVEHLAPVRK